jgi:hypothetical protein
MKTKSKRTKSKPKSKPVNLALYPVTLFTQGGNRVECLQYCRDDEHPLSGQRYAEGYFGDIESALNHYQTASKLSTHVRRSAPAPLLILSAPVA